MQHLHNYSRIKQFADSLLTLVLQKFKPILYMMYEKIDEADLAVD